MTSFPRQRGLEGRGSDEGSSSARWPHGEGSEWPPWGGSGVHVEDSKRVRRELRGSLRARARGPHCARARRRAAGDLVVRAASRTEGASWAASGDGVLPGGSRAEAAAGRWQRLRRAPSSAAHIRLRLKRPGSVSRKARRQAARGKRAARRPGTSGQGAGATGPDAPGPQRARLPLKTACALQLSGGFKLREGARETGRARISWVRF
jgi:hypothetical protein